MENKFRTAVLYKHYFIEFISRQKRKSREKIDWTIKLIETIPRVPEQYLKHIEGTEGLFEIRVQSGTDIFRIFCFFDSGKLVILMNGFQKKSQKTPKQEIAKALHIKKEYENEKE